MRYAVAILLSTFLLGLLSLLTLALVLTGLAALLTGVPFVPTPRAVREAMIGMVPWRGNETVFDLGAGDGRVLLDVKKRFPGVTAIGCEIAPTVWLLGKLRLLGSGVRLRLRSALREDVRNADVVLLYLFPHLLKALAAKFDRELMPGTLVVSQTFSFSGRVPLAVRRARGYAGEVSVFLYRWEPPAPAQVQDDGAEQNVVREEQEDVERGKIHGGERNG